VERTETKLEVAYRRSPMSGVGLSGKLNGQPVHLLLDTGAGGIMVSREVGEQAALTRLSTIHFGGIGDKGLRSGYMALADHIQIGDLEFHDCVVAVSDTRLLPEADGLIGADVFGAYLVDIDLPAMRLRLSPLPKRPEDAVAPTALNSEGEEQANAEQKEAGATTQAPNGQKPSAPLSNPSERLPRDRYIAPEMANWTKVFHFGHTLLVPTRVNDSPAMLFGLDTGAFANLLSLRAGQQASKVNPEDRTRVRGLSGKVDKVYSAKATLRFGHLRQPNMDIVTLDLSSTSEQLGTEVSGFLGFDMLSVLDVKLDYRDGLVDFEYHPKHIWSFVK